MRKYTIEEAERVLGAEVGKFIAAIDGEAAGSLVEDTDKLGFLESLRESCYEVLTDKHAIIVVKEVTAGITLIDIQEWTNDMISDLVFDIEVYCREKEVNVEDTFKVLSRRYSIKNS